MRARIYMSLLALDIACIFASFFAASRLMNSSGANEQWFVLCCAIALVYGVVAFNARAFSSQVIVRPNLGILRAVQSLVLAGLTVVVLAFYLKTSGGLSRGLVGFGSLFSLVSLTIARQVFLRRAHRAMGGQPYCVALIMDGAFPINPGEFSIVIHAGSEIDPDNDCPETLDRLAIALRTADRVIVACDADRRARWVQMLKGANIRSEITAPELRPVAPLALDQWSSIPTMVVADGPLGKTDSVLKRALDIVVSGGALIALAPLMVVIAILVKTSSAGPVFFIQTRIGQGNRMFPMYKFRSMRTEWGDSAGHTSASRDDDRITPTGRFIRRTSIDELPQLINVLIGDMSIVGPRPHALGSRAENKLFWEVDDRYWHRHAAKPGLTGLAQVRGFRGATERTSDLTNRLQADLEYLHDWSLWRDILIMIQTFKVLVHRNAY